MAPFQSIKRERIVYFESPTIDSSFKIVDLLESMLLQFSDHLETLKAEAAVNYDILGSIELIHTFKNLVMRNIDTFYFSDA